MLRELSVQNLALIEDARVELHGGYCAWTGETGAGKSLLLTALGLVLGGKATADLVRAGKAEARAAAVFDVACPALRADLEAILGGPIEDDQLILTRRVSAQGRGAAHVNGLPVAAATLSTRPATCWTPTVSANCSTPTAASPAGSGPITTAARPTPNCGGGGSSCGTPPIGVAANRPYSPSSWRNWPRPTRAPASTTTWPGRPSG